MRPRMAPMIVGVMFIAMGAILLMSNLGHIRLDYAELWPILILGAGLAFLAGFLANRKEAGLLMPGTILTVCGLLFWYCAVEGWYHMTDLWPLFVVAPGLGFVAMYMGGLGSEGLLIPGGILIGVGSIFLMQRHGLHRYWPVLLIGVGAALVLEHYWRNRSATDENPEDE